ncbi:MAG: hypothetical protein Q9157_006827 [Trypethelium eluteriae]
MLATLSSRVKREGAGGKLNKWPSSTVARLHSLLHPVTVDRGDSGPAFQGASRNNEAGALVFSDTITNKESDAERRDIALTLIDVVTDMEGYTDQMDAFLSSLARLQPSCLSSDSTDITQNAMDILGRMPQVPQQVSRMPSLEGHEYLGAQAGKLRRISLDREVPKRHGNISDKAYMKEKHFNQWCEMDSLVWRTLVKDWPIDSNTLKILLWVASTAGRPDHSVANRVHAYITFLSQLFESVSHKRSNHQPPANSERHAKSEKLRWEIASIWKLYLSICWQRATMLLFYYTLRTIYEKGWSSERAALLNDIMCVDLKKKEWAQGLLATLVVADWNVRGWTLLEGLRGRSNVHLLCANNELVSLKRLFDTIFSSGGLDMIMFLAGVQHLLPGVSLSYEESGFLLGRRVASRPGDELIIWGLISQDAATQSGADTVRGVKRVRTGFLVSRLPRVNAKGLHWAPAAAHMRYDFSASDIDRRISEWTEETEGAFFATPPLSGPHTEHDFSGSDGEGSDWGEQTEAGLQATWLVHHIDKRRVRLAKDKHEPTFENFYAPVEVADAHLHLRFFRGGAQVPAIDEYEHLALLHPKRENADDPYDGIESQDWCRPLVLCGSADRNVWRWIRAFPCGYLGSGARDSGETLCLDHFSPEKIILD